MGRVIGLVAYHVFKESVRDKVLYNLVLFAVLMIGASYLIGQLTAGQDVKIIKDLGLAASSVFGVLRRTAEAGSRELLTVAAQEEFVAPSRRFDAIRC